MVMEMKDFEKLLEKVAAGEAGPEDFLRLKNFVEENPNVKARWQAATEACAIIREAGRFSPLASSDQDSDERF